MTEPKQQPKDAQLGYKLPYPGGEAMYAFNQRWQADPQDVDEMRIQEADDRYRALKDDGRPER